MFSVTCKEKEEEEEEEEDEDGDAEGDEERGTRNEGGRGGKR